MSLEDQAQEHEAKVWAYNNRPREVVKYEPTDPQYGPEECAECGAEMPTVRREMGRQLCTPCQNAREITAKRFGQKP